jgi:hypothetical protein
MNRWRVMETVTRRRNRARIPEARVVATIFYVGSHAEHSLPGPHGRQVLHAAAQAWNACGYCPTGRHTPCAGDLLTEAARRKKQLTGRYS